MGTFVRRVTTASGATAVQIMHKRGRRVLGIEHIGSAHTEADLAVLVEVARVRLHAGQEQLPWELESDTGPTGPAGLEPLVEGTASLLLWDALAGVNHHDRPPAPHSRATRPYPDPTDPRRPHPECALKRANSGLPVNRKRLSTISLQGFLQRSEPGRSYEYYRIR